MGREKNVNVRFWLADLLLDHTLAGSDGPERDMRFCLRRRLDFYDVKLLHPGILTTMRRRLRRSFVSGHPVQQNSKKPEGFFSCLKSDDYRHPPGVFDQTGGRTIRIRALSGPRSGKVVQRSPLRARIPGGVNLKIGGFWEGVSRRVLRGSRGGIWSRIFPVLFRNFFSEFFGIFFMCLLIFFEQGLLKFFSSGFDRSGKIFRQGHDCD